MMDRICNFTKYGLVANKSFPSRTISHPPVNCSFDYDYGIPNQTGLDKNTEISLRLFFSSLASIANCLLLFVMYIDPLKRFRNSTSYLIFNLAIADLLSIVAGICQSVFLLNIDNSLKSKQEMAGCFSAIGVQCSFLMIMIFAMDRYMAIAHPYKYKNIVTRKYILVILILLPWCFAIIALPVIYFEPAYKDERTLTNLFAGDIIALTVITLVVHPVTHWEFKKKIKALAQSSYINKEIMKENLKIAKVLASTVLLVSVCLITFMSPYFVAFCFSLSDCNKCFLSKEFQSLWRYYPLLTSVRLLTNSFVYTWRLPLYRQSLRGLLGGLNCLNFGNHSRVANRIQQMNTSTKFEITEQEARHTKRNLPLQGNHHSGMDPAFLQVMTQKRASGSSGTGINNGFTEETYF